MPFGLPELSAGAAGEYLSAGKPRKVVQPPPSLAVEALAFTPDLDCSNHKARTRAREGFHASLPFFFSLPRNPSAFRATPHLFEPIVKFNDPPINAPTNRYQESTTSTPPARPPPPPPPPPRVCRPFSRFLKLLGCSTNLESRLEPL